MMSLAALVASHDHEVSNLIDMMLLAFGLKSQWEHGSQPRGIFEEREDRTSEKTESSNEDGH